MKILHRVTTKGYRNYVGDITKFIALTLLTETRLNVEQYGGQREVLVPLMAVVCKCQTNTDNTGGNSYGQPQVVTERCDIAIPRHVGVAG